LKKRWRHSDRQITYSNMRKSALLAIAFALTLGCSTNRNYLVYPGNGFPYLSKDKEISKLQEELKECSLQHKNTYFNEGRFEFMDVSDFTFVSSNKFSGKRLVFDVDLRI